MSLNLFINFNTKPQIVPPGPGAVFDIVISNISTQVMRSVLSLGMGLIIPSFFEALLSYFFLLVCNIRVAT
jgi:hypothetical protein